MVKKFILRLFFKLLKKNPANMEMVQYWKTKEAAQAKITKGKDGSTIMYIEGEKFPFPTFPRGHILFGHISKLKHEIKNQVFNESWWKLEKGVSKEEIIKDIKEKLFGSIIEIADKLKFDMLPPEAMCPSVREIHRGWSKIENEFKGKQKENLQKLKDYLCFILQEDDGYRMRVQWLINYFNPSSFWMRLFGNPIKAFDYGLQMVEHAEIVGDMKERIRLLRRILLLALEDKVIKTLFLKLCREVNWNKVKLTRAEKYHFRGKWFKVDYDILEY